MIEVLIGVQARSTSTRLPGKSLELIDNLTMVEHVMAACEESASHLNKRSNLTKINCESILLVPTNDAIVHHYGCRYQIVEGPEHDVLTRYAGAVVERNPDYLVRCTADCPLIAPAIISKHITTAVNNKLDYCANVYEKARTYVDGYDVEVISKKLFMWLVASATDSFDREHVTTYLRRHKPAWASYGAVIGHIDLGDIKMSVDTREDLEITRRNKRSVLEKIKEMKKHGIAVYRF